MVITSPFSSIKGFIVSKPPLVLFTLCLMGFAITTFTFAYYVEHNENLPNLDAHRDLLSFLKHLGKRVLCINQNDSVKTETAFNISDFDLTTIYVSANLDSNLANHNVTYFESFVPMTDWVSECTSSPIEKVKISFLLQINQSVDSEICVMITGPKSVLESGVSEDHCKFPTFQHNSVSHIYKNDLHCSEGKLTKLVYSPISHNSLTLTQRDRSVINLHLFHTSYFLLVMAITLICYAMIKGKPVTKHQTGEKTPLEV